MTTRKGVSRRQIIVGTTGAGAALATGILGFPAIGRAQADAIKIGHLTPRTGFLGVLGDYATVADMNTFLASKTERHPTDLAKLHGARLVVAQEVRRLPGAT